MLTSNEKKLVYILAIVLVICATGLFFYLRITMKNTGLNDLNRQILEIENLVQKIGNVEEKDEDLLLEIENIEQQIEIERSKFYLPDVTDIANFGLKVKDLILKNRLKITAQRTISQKDVDFIEFTCSGKANNLTNFIKGVSTAEKHWRIDTLTIQSNNIDGNIDAKIRITYETIATDNN